MKQRQLQKTLNDLVSGFGYENVRETLVKIGSEKTHTANRNAKIHQVAADKPAVKKTKPNAVKVVKSLDIADNEKSEILFILANKYEEKQFMPNVNHVRDFLCETERDVSRIKSRQQVTAAVFKQLANLDTAKLREILGRGLYGPPKRLEPFARAIEGFNKNDRSV